MLHYDWENSVGHWIVTTANALRRSLNSELASEGITLRQWEVLACLAIGGELSQTELAERLGIEAPTLVGILDRMERDGWLDRCSCPDDRRKKRIRSTQKSELLWARMVDCAHRVRARATQGLQDDEILVIRKVCDRMLANLGTGAEVVADAPAKKTAKAGKAVRLPALDPSLAETVVDFDLPPHLTGGHAKPVLNAVPAAEIEV